MNKLETTTNGEQATRLRKKVLRGWERRSYDSPLAIADAVRSGQDVYWTNILHNEPALLRGFLHWFAGNLEGSPPASMIYSTELSQQHGFLNGHSPIGLYGASTRALHEGREIVMSLDIFWIKQEYQ